MTLIRALCVLAVLVIAREAAAHDTYLLPLKVAQRAPIIVQMTSAERFPAIEYGPKLARIARTLAVEPDRGATLTPMAESESAMRLSFRARRAGTYALALALQPHDIDLAPDKVAEYFAEIDAPMDVRAAYEALPEPRTWRETYTKYAKSFVCLRLCAGDALTRSSGLELEFVLGAKRIGGQPTFVLLHHGEPLADQPLSLFDRGGNRTALRTDKDGAVAVSLPKTGGVLLSTVVVTTQANADDRFVSAFATLTFDARILAAR